MVDQIAVVTFTSPATATTVDVTSSQITETFSGAIFIYAHSTTEGSLEATGVVGMGFVTEEIDDAGLRQGHIAPSLRDGITTANQAFTTILATSAIRVVNGALTTVGVYSASISGGVRLSFSDGGVGDPDEQLRVTAILFAGLSRASVGSVGATTTGVHADVGNSSPGLFEPNIVFGFTGDGALNAGQDDGTSSFGVCINDGSETQISSFCNFDRVLDPGDADGQVSSSTFAIGHQGITRAVRTTSVTSFDSSGFNVTSTQGTQTIVYLALKWTNATRARMAAANLSVAASTGLQAFNSFGFTPDLVFGRSTLIDALDTYTDGADAASQGLFISGKHGSWALSGSHQEGDLRPSQADTLQEASALVMVEHASNSNGVVAWRADWAGATGSGGFYLNFSAASMTGFLTAVGIQINYEAPRTQYKPRRARLRRKAQRVKLPPILSRSAAQEPSVLFRVFRKLRELTLRRLQRRPEPPIIPSSGTFSDEVADPAGSVFSPGAVRGSVQSGGSAAGDVF